jgi:hypothetical protein
VNARANDATAFANGFQRARLRRHFIGTFRLNCAEVSRENLRRNIALSCEGKNGSASSVYSRAVPIFFSTIASIASFGFDQVWG